MAVTAWDLMTRDVLTLSPEMTLAAMDELLLRRGVSGAPVVEDLRLVGVASQADVVRILWEGQKEASRIAAYHSSPFPISIPALERIAKDSHQISERMIQTKVRDIMTEDPLVARPDDAIEDVANRMVRDQIHRLPVVEANGGELVGIITTLDLVRAITTYGLVSFS
jgi:CBS domain-containing protein